MGSLTKGETRDTVPLSGANVAYQTTVKYLPYFFKPFSLNHLQDLFMAHGCVGVFLQNLKEHKEITKKKSHNIVTKQKNSMDGLLLLYIIII